MPIIKWKTAPRFGGQPIERVECTRETAQTVWYLSPGVYASSAAKERRAAKIGDYEQYHDTWEAAHAYLMERADSAVVGARRSLELANAKLGNVKGMRKPAEAESEPTDAGRQHVRAV